MNELLASCLKKSQHGRNDSHWKFVTLLSEPVNVEEILCSSVDFLNEIPTSVCSDWISGWDKTVIVIGSKSAARKNASNFLPYLHCDARDRFLLALVREDKRVVNCLPLETSQRSSDDWLRSYMERQSSSSSIYFTIPSRKASLEMILISCIHLLAETLYLQRLYNREPYLQQPYIRTKPLDDIIEEFRRSPEPKNLRLYGGKSREFKEGELIGAVYLR